MSESQPTQSRITAYEPETTSESITRCIVCPLEASSRKREYLRRCVGEWQDIARFTAERLRSFDKGDISRNNAQVYKIVKEWPDRTINASVAREAAYKAVEAYESWFELGQPRDPPIGKFGSGDYLRAHNQQVSVVENDRGYGVKLRLMPRKPEWFHVNMSDHQSEWLERVCDPDDSARHGAAEVYLHDDGGVALHLAIVSDVEIVVSEGVERWLGVDLGERTLYSTACVGTKSGNVENVTVEPGKEYRHHREQLKRKHRELQRKGDLRGVRKCKGEIEKYTEWILHTASKQVVEIAANRDPCGIRLEEMGDYRETAPDPIHDWPRGKFAEYITYKATAAGIPVEFVDPAYTSQTCRKCGQTDEEARDGSDFHCRRCGYEVHADVNAAINIAQKDS